jgi:hypothetical protein
MDNKSFPVSISFHIFNRPKVTRKVFEQIRDVRPFKLFITADGPRESVRTDNKKCEDARSIIDSIDWECEVYTNFSDTNKGSYRSTSEGITWVFEHVERAIILEDDCVPHPSFFRFCHELLERYEHDERIALISGTNFMFGTHEVEGSYFFSRYTHMWGWATWKRTWDQVDFSMANWEEFRDAGGLKLLFRKRHEVLYWHEIMQQMYDGEKGPHWDYLLLLSMFMNNSLAIRPKVNLIYNDGYGEGATNFDARSIIHEVDTEGIEFPLKHPRFICRDLIAEEITEKYEFSGGLKVFLTYRIANRVFVILPELLVVFLKRIRRFCQMVMKKLS